MELVYGNHYCDCPHLPESIGLKNSAVNYDNLVKSTGINITVEPNPAKSWVTFNYSLPSYISVAKLELSDVNGNRVATFALKQSKGQQVWDIRKVKPGTYIYSLKNGHLSESGKLIIE